MEAECLKSTLKSKLEHRVDAFLLKNGKSQRKNKKYFIPSYSALSICVVWPFSTWVGTGTLKRRCLLECGRDREGRANAHELGIHAHLRRSRATNDRYVVRSVNCEMLLETKEKKRKQGVLQCSIVCSLGSPPRPVEHMWGASRRGGTLGTGGWHRV